MSASQTVTDIITILTAVGALATALAAAWAHVLVARQNHRVSSAVSRDLTTLADASSGVRSEDLNTPRVLNGLPPPPTPGPAGSADTIG